MRFFPLDVIVWLVAWCGVAPVAVEVGVGVVEVGFSAGSCVWVQLAAKSSSGAHSAAARWCER